MAKSPGFWFFTGDWMKDPELRFCSIFARGLLVDLLCILHEAKEQGYASNPDGTPRPDEQIIDAISGGSRDEKLSALAELEKNGVLSRDSRGVLFSRRVARLAELSRTRKQNGSKGGSKTSSKTRSKLAANLKQNEQQNGGVSVSDSVSDSFLIKTHTPRVREADDEFRKPGWAATEWDAFLPLWNACKRAARWDGLGPPSGWVDAAASPGWLQNARKAVERLGRCQFFDNPLAITQFLEPGWVDRINAGEFDNAKRGRSKPERGGDFGGAPAPPKVWTGPEEAARVALLERSRKLKEEVP